MPGDLAEIDKDILAFDIPDDALERAAAANGRAITLPCPQWYDCGWPLLGDVAQMKTARSSLRRPGQQKRAFVFLEWSEIRMLAID
jgi:hypothetical protein